MQKVNWKKSMKNTEFNPNFSQKVLHTLLLIKVVLTIQDIFGSQILN